ncbi:hypothetical protein [Paenibacillus graminis]|uniref:hypothetical protein n=1 Tax=Paenibacillus graminis TaxID=189425 RepID=UPI002DBA5162|nr:hypothetical protein [Paenibacillus graminis]MEC0171143.1 hypothetical protein [Paenibacillus graminis]
MNEAAIREAFDGKGIEQLVDYLLKETYDSVQKNGVTHMLELMEKVIAEQFKGRKAPAFARGIFLISIQSAVKYLYAVPGQRLDVAYGIDNKGPWVTAICSSGSYVLWRADPLKCYFHDWEREAVHYVR